MCCICKEKQATVHLTQIVGDKMQKVDLCEECAKTKGVNDPPAFRWRTCCSAWARRRKSSRPAAASKSKCPRCGFTQADFKKAGRLGCAECYKTFAEGLEGLLKTMHKGTRHVGKVPEALRQSRDLADRLKLLQKKLDKAVDDEDFEAGRPVARRNQTDRRRAGRAWRCDVNHEHCTNFSSRPPKRARRHGPHDRIVMSSRVRLARNLQGRGVSRLGQKAGAGPRCWK